MQLIVLGMHRSGTSAVTRLLNMMGASVGNAENMMDPHPANPKGFWENRQLVDIDMKLLVHQQSNWQCLIDFDPHRCLEADYDELRLEAQKFITKLEVSRPWVIKDPRICLTLPFWRPLLEKPVFVFIHRSPLEVAQSLLHAQQIPMHIGIALWEKYTLEALSGSADAPRVFIHHKDLIKDPVAVTQQLKTSLEAYGVRRLELPNDDEIHAFIDPKLYREKSTVERELQFLNHAQKHLFDLLEKNDETALTTLPALSEGAQVVLTDHQNQVRQTIESNQKFTEIQTLSDACQSVILDHESHLEEYLGTIESMKQQFKAQTDRYESLQTHNNEQQATIEKQVQQLAKVHESLAKQQSAHAASQQKVQSLQQSNQEYIQKMTLLDEKILSHTKTLEILQAKLTKQQSELQSAQAQCAVQEKRVRQEQQKHQSAIQHWESHEQEIISLNTRRQSHIDNIEGALATHKATLQHREHEVTVLMAKLKTIQNQLHALPVLPIIRAIRTQSLLKQIDTSISETQHWYNHEYQDSQKKESVILSRQVTPKEAIAGFNLQQYWDDEYLLLSWFDALYTDIQKMDATRWWKIGLALRMGMGKMGLRPANPLMEFTRATQFKSQVDQWRAKSDGRIEYLNTTPTPHTVAITEIHRLLQWIEHIYTLTMDMEKIHWWQLGAKLNFITRIRTPESPAVNARRIMQHLTQWKESIHLSPERYVIEDTHTVSSTQVRPHAPAPIPNSPAILQALPKCIDIIVPIYNEYEYVRRCVLSILRNTQFNYRLILIDDGSTEPELDQLYTSLKSLDHVIIHRNAENMGFVGSVNAGFARSQHDVVLLNSDVCVTPRWLRKLAIAAHTKPETATVTTLSNAATIYSLPKFAENNPIPENYTVNSFARMVENLAQRKGLIVPTAVGCCMYIKQQALKEVGTFDHETFGRGYGEENDFCMRVIAKGWTNILDDSTFIFHKNSVTFGPEKEQLIEDHLNILHERYPEYPKLVSDFVESGVIQSIIERTDHGIQQHAQAAYNPGQCLACQDTKRILYVLHDGGGGTLHMAHDLSDTLPDHYESFYLTCDTHKISLSAYVRNQGPIELESFLLSTSITVSDFSHDQYREIVGEILLRYPFDLIHIHHLISHTFDLPRIAHTLGIPYIFTFHDLYMICPTVHMLNYDQQFCAGECTACDDRQCTLPTPNLAMAPLLPGKWALTWRKEVQAILGNAAGFITPTENIKQFFLKMYPELKSTNFLAIEHGRDLEVEKPVATSPDQNKVVRIVTIGDIVLHKGAELFRELANIDQGRTYEIHILGPVHEELTNHPGIICHGRFERADLHGLLESIQPSVVMLLSIWPETFCYTLSEAWSMGIPAVVSDLGALKERVEREGGGWIVDHNSAPHIHTQLQKIFADTEGYAQRLREIEAMQFKTLATMADEYDQHYTTFMRTCSRQNEAAAHTKPVVAIIPGSRKVPYNGTDCYRLLQPFEALATNGDIETVVCDLNRVADTYPDAIVVQRTALSTDEAHALITYCRNESIKLIYDIDDNLLDMDDHPDKDEYIPLYEAITLLLTHADAVTVSTETLKTVLSKYNDTIQVIPNFIDHTLWAKHDSAWTLPEINTSNDSLTIGYMGTISHIHDLAIVEDAIKQLCAKHPHVTMELVGGRANDDGQDWYTRVIVPDDNYQFRKFTQWFRDTRHWDIAIAPLENSPFNTYKSNVKALEYGFKGVPTIYSDHSVYTTLIQEGINGLLVENTTEAWYQALDRMVSDHALRETIRQSAFDHITHDHLLQNNLETLRSLLFNTLEKD